MTVIQMPYVRDDAVPVGRLLVPVSDDLSDTELDVEQLGSRIVGMAGRIAAATCRWLLLVADFDAREGYQRFGLTSTGRWLAHYCGLARRTAIEHVRVARALAAYPVLADAMSAGRVSFSQARAISRLAGVATPALISDLVSVAEHGSASQLEEMVRGLRTVDDHARDLPHASGEELSARWRDDSRWGLTARLDPEHGALVASALETVARREGLTQAEALTRLAELALASVRDADETGGQRPVPTLRGDEHAAVVIHLSAVPHAEGCSAEHPRPIARIAGGAGLPDRVVERLLCSARVRVATFDPRVPPGEPPSPLDVGASRRLVSDKQFRALLLRDGGCRYPGCGSRHNLEAHHVQHWLRGGRTVMANLVLLCRKHHHAHHDGEFDIITLGANKFRFLTADGRELPRHVNPADLAGETLPIENEHIHVAPDAATTRWDGTHLDHHYAIAGLTQGLRRAQASTLDPWAA